jgi:large subunit ribosomal protein L4
MAVVDVYNLDRDKVGTLELSDAVFGVRVREHLFHEVVRYQLAKRRGGNACTKGRALVAGTTAKVWKQKGTGRARQGTKKAPHWVGGGVVHGPTPHDFTPKLNKKVRAAALRAALSRRQEEGALTVLDSFELSEIKTRRVAGVLATFGTPKALIVDTAANVTLAKSARNLAKAKFVAVDGVNVYDILKHDALLITREAAKAIEGRLA